MIKIAAIKATGLYLLEILKAEKAVRYSRFYNSVPETETSLAAGALKFVVSKEDRTGEELREDGHVMLEYAAWQLEDLRIVQITFLDDILIDDEPDFRIAITESGERVLAEGLNFTFRHPEYSISATPASEWIICCQATIILPHQRQL